MSNDAMASIVSLARRLAVFLGFSVAGRSVMVWSIVEENKHVFSFYNPTH